MEEDSFISCCICKRKDNNLTSSSTINDDFLVNTDLNCGHRFCQSCIERQLQRRTQFPCPVCQTPVSRDKLSVKSSVVTEAEKDTAVRRKLKAIFNKREVEFTSKEEYLDYEEMVEDCIFNLVHNIDLEATQLKIEDYKKRHMNIIARNEDRSQDQRQEEEQNIKEERARRALREEQFQHSLRADLQQRQLAQQRQNAFLLGESGTGLGALPTFDNNNNNHSNNGNLAMAATATTATAGGVHPVVAYLCQRPEPQPVLQAGTARSLPPPPSSSGPGNTRALHLAGGYDYLWISGQHQRQAARQQLEERRLSGEGAAASTVD